MSENNENDSSKAIIWIILAILVILAIFLICFRGNKNDNNTQNPNIYQSTNQNDNMVSNTINIVDANTKELYERVKKGITLDGKLIEVPANYMKKITDKITKEGYKITDETKTAVNNKLDEIENIIKSEGKTDIKDLSNESQTKIKNIAKDIEDML